MSQVTRRGGNGDKGVCLQPGLKKLKGKASAAQFILISHQDLLILHARRKFIQKTIYLCPAEATQQCTASRLSVWHDLTTDLIAALELLTEADRSHVKVITALLLLIFGQSDGYFIFATGYWQPIAAQVSTETLFVCTVRGHAALTRRQTGLGGVGGVRWGTFSWKKDFTYDISILTSSLRV